MAGLAISFVVWTGENGMEILADQLNLFAFAWSFFIHQDTFHWEWCYFSRNVSDNSTEPKNYLVGKVQFQFSVGILLRQLPARFVRI